MPAPSSIPTPFPTPTPAPSAPVDTSQPLTVPITADQAKKEAIGKTLGLVGASVGAVGTIMALSANPTFKQRAGSSTTRILMILAVGGIAAYFISNYLMNKPPAPATPAAPSP